MRILFHFLCAKDLRIYLLIMITRSFLTLLYIGGTYTQQRGGGQRPPPYVGGTYTRVQGQGQRPPPVIPSCDEDRGLHLTTSTLGTIPP